MKQQNKKGFTIVELVIVIAVIAILAAILVPLISNLVKRAHVTSDTQLVRNLNTSLAMDPAGKHITMQSALDAVAKNGFDVAKINAAALDNMILWDSENDVFCYYEKDDDGNVAITYIPESISGDPLPVDSYKLWMISDTVSDTYSTYYTGTATSVDITKGFDAGISTTLTSVSYVRTSGEAQNVVIRTNSASTELVVNAPNDTVKHYDAVGQVHVIAVDPNNCYEENGKAAFTQVDSGKFKTSATADVKLLFVSNSSSVNLEIAEGTVDHAHASSEAEANTINGTDPGVVFDYDGNDAQSELDVYHHVENDDKINLTTDFNDNKDNEGVQCIVEETISEEIIKKGAENGDNYVARYGTTGYMSVGAAINAAATSGKVYILKDADVNPSDFSKIVTLVGNKQTLKFVRSSENNTSDALNVFKVNGELTFDLNGKAIQGKSYINSTYYEPLIVNNGKLTIKDSVGGGLLTTNSNNANAVILLNLGDFVLESGTLGGPVTGSTTFKCGTPIIVGSHSTTTINGGIIIGDSRAIGLSMAKQNIEPTATINNTSFNSTYNNKIIINGGTLASRSAEVIELSTRSKGANYCDETTNEIIINGGTFQHVNNDAGITYNSDSTKAIIAVQKGHANITINDGTFNASNGNVIEVLYESFHNSIFNIKGGNFTTSESKYVLKVTKNTSTGDSPTDIVYNVDGGTFSQINNLLNAEEGLKANISGTYSSYIQ